MTALEASAIIAGVDLVIAVVLLRMVYRFARAIFRLADRRFDEADHISSDSPEWLAGLRGGFNHNHRQGDI